MLFQTCKTLFMLCGGNRHILKKCLSSLFFKHKIKGLMLFWLALYGQTQLNRYCWTCGEINEFEIWSRLLNPFLKGEQHIVGITFVVKTSEEGGSQNSETVWQLAVFLLGKALHYQPVVLRSFHSISSLYCDCELCIRCG